MAVNPTMTHKNIQGGLKSPSAQSSAIHVLQNEKDRERRGENSSPTIGIAAGYILSLQKTLK